MYLFIDSYVYLFVYLLGVSSCSFFFGGGGLTKDTHVDGASKWADSNAAHAERQARFSPQ